MADNKELELIDLRKITRTLIAHRKAFVKPLAIVFVLSCIYIMSLPRYYSTEARLAPEMGSGLSGGTLGSLASSFGIDLGSMESNDAITPLLYPDLLEDNAFIANLFPVHVEDSKGEVSTTYYDYLCHHQKSAWWSGPFDWMRSTMKKLFSSDEGGSGEGTFDPYALSKEDDALADLIRSNIRLRVDKKDGVITISVTDQDPLICRTIADSVQLHLQTFITNYRTNKARIDVEYYEALADSAQAAYKQAARLFAQFSDANTNVVLQSYRTKAEDLENDMQLKFNTYSLINTQLQAARGKVQERTPAFTVLKGASLPVKPAGPKRMLFVLGMLILTFFATSGWILFKESA